VSAAQATARTTEKKVVTIRSNGFIYPNTCLHGFMPLVSVSTDPDDRLDAATPILWAMPDQIVLNCIHME
jgi:hypothetical protein